MSIVSYHARVSESLLDALQTNPDLIWTLPQNADPAEAELFSTDKDWQTLFLASFRKGARRAQARGGRVRSLAQA